MTTDKVEFDPTKHPNCVYCGHRPHHEIRFNEGGRCPVGVAFSCFGPRKRRENCDCSPCRCGECIAKLPFSDQLAVRSWIGFDEDESSDSSKGAK